MKRFFRTTLFLLAAFGFMNAQADNKGNLTVSNISAAGSGMVYVATDIQAPNTCKNYAFSFRIDASTDGGQNMLSILLAAKMAGKKVQIWYNPATGTGNNCALTELASVYRVAIQPE